VIFKKILTSEKSLKDLNGEGDRRRHILACGRCVKVGGSASRFSFKEILLVVSVKKKELELMVKEGDGTKRKGQILWIFYNIEIFYKIKRACSFTVSWKQEN
jgi:hypothetical protein